jgi:hypothetical protein
MPASPASKAVRINLQIDTDREEVQSPTSVQNTDGETSPLSPFKQHDRLLTCESIISEEKQLNVHES